MKHLLLFTVVLLFGFSAHAADGDTIKAKTIEGVEMIFTILSEDEKTVSVSPQYYDPYFIGIPLEEAPQRSIKVKNILKKLLFRQFPYLLKEL